MKRRRPCFARLTLLLALGSSACDEAPKGPAAGATGGPPASASRTPPAPERPSPPAPRPRPSGCRALSVRGEARLGTTALVTGMLVDGKRWLELDKGAHVSFRHTSSARELTLKGPGRALPCVDGEEDVILAQGEAQTSAGPGARPGAQVTLYSPLGTVSYGDARIDIRASGSKVDVAVTKGEAWVEPAAGARRAGPQTVRGPKGRATLSGAPTPAGLVKDCEDKAAEAEKLAQAVLGPAAPDAGSLGDRAAAHVRARQAARAACGAARAATARAPEDAVRRDLERRLEDADRRWRAVGGPAASAPKPSAG